MSSRAGRIGSAEVLLAVGGVGATRAQQSSEAILATGWPELLIIAGVAGALTSDLSVGDLVAATSVLTEIGLLTPPMLLPGLRQGALLSANRVLITAQEKGEAVLRPGGPMAVEMETAGSARAAIECGVPWAAVRAISDNADEPLPLDFNQARTSDGSLSISRIALMAIARPRSIPGLIRFSRDTDRAATTLARYLAGWLSGHPHPMP